MQFAIQYDRQYNMQYVISKNSKSDTKILYISEEEEEEDSEEEEENSKEEEENSEEEAAIAKPLPSKCVMFKIIFLKTMQTYDNFV